MDGKSFVERVYTRSGRVIAFDPPLCVFNLGCGFQRYPNVIGVDRSPDSAADIVHDLNVFPWPIPDASADIVLAFHVLEHLDNLPRVMEEICRITKHGGRLVVEVPHFRSVGAFQDPTHKHFFTTKTMDYFCSNRSRDAFGYSTASFLLKDFWIGWPASRNVAVRYVKKFIRTYPDFYDKYLSLLFPAPIVVFELEAQKP